MYGTAFTPPKKAPVAMLKEWLLESYCAVAPVKLASQVDPRAAAKPAPKKKAAAKPSPKKKKAAAKPAPKKNAAAKPAPKKKAAPKKK